MVVAWFVLAAFAIVIASALGPEFARLLAGTA
jgi:hypothetical protein